LGIGGGDFDDMTHPLDDVKRCEDMEKFESWRETPFFIASSMQYKIISTRKFSPLQFIMNIDPNLDFQRWLAHQNQLLNPVDRAKLHRMCFELNQSSYSIDQINPLIERSLMYWVALTVHTGCCTKY
jgi:hypothetical protein